MDNPNPGFRDHKLDRAESQIERKPVTCIVLLLSFCFAGCGAPGEPLPPTPPIPTAVTDLTGSQEGDGVLLNFTMPKKSVVGDTLLEVPTMEILRGTVLPNGTPDPKSFRVVDTVPGAMMASYTQRGSVHFLDPVAPDLIQAHPGATVVYRVRARVTDKKASADSNDAFVKLLIVAAAVTDLHANLTERGIELTWTAPVSSSAGAPIAGIEEYRMYRGEIDPAAAETAGKDLSHATWKSPLVQIASAKTSGYRDTAFDYGKTYVYVVRGALIGEGEGLESSDSNAVVLTPKDIFPPRPPQDVVAAVVPGSPDKSTVDLSWSINVEADLAGYRVYRSETQGERGLLITNDLLLTPAYQDTTALPGRHYWYTVTAVDRAGNESATSEQITVEIAQPST